MHRVKQHRTTNNIIPEKRTPNEANQFRIITAQENTAKRKHLTRMSIPTSTEWNLLDLPTNYKSTLICIASQTTLKTIDNSTIWKPRREKGEKREEI